MTPLQQELAQQLQGAAVNTGGWRVVYRTKYLGYLPFGQYHWVTVAGVDVSLACPDGWEWRDLEGLAVGWHAQTLWDGRGLRSIATPFEDSGTCHTI